MTYASIYQQSMQEKEAFWAEQANSLHWFEKSSTPLTQDENGFYRWFKGGKMNTAYLALDYHVENGRADQPALIYDSPATHSQRTYTYRELRDEVALLAGGLLQLGVNKGDTVVIYMPMVPEAAIAMLACARIGAVHSVVFGGFAPHELAVRIDDAQPTAIISASCGIEFDKVLPYKPLLDEAILTANHKPTHCVILQRPQLEAPLIEPRDITYTALLANATPAPCTVLDATDPLYILYTSGTTGKPKGIIRDQGGHAVALHYSMKNVYNVSPGDVYWAASDVGWVVGHSYIVYAPLIYGCTTILFEGKPIRTPDAGTFWRVISEHKVKCFFTAPTAFRAIKKEDPDALLLQKYDISCLDAIYVAGERCDPPTMEWLQNTTQKPIYDHWWQTETGWAIVGNLAGVEALPVKLGSATKPVPGFELHILNEAGEVLGANQEGYVCLKLPLPPGCLPSLWKDDARFKSSYLTTFEGYYLTGDGGYIDEDGYVFIMGRVDDVINVAGHRLSTGSMEEIIASHPAVAECAVVGIADELRGQRPVGFAVLKDGASIEEEALEIETIQLVREQIGAVAFYRNTLLVKRLPKTRSGKILRKIMRQIADGEDFTVPSTIDDPAILAEIKQRLHERTISK